MSFKPMLSARVDDLERLQFPLLVSPKLDGIRATVVNGVLVSRNLKPIPNEYVRSVLSNPVFEGLDGELIVGDPSSKDVFNTTTRGIMTRAGTPNFQFHVFDNVRYPNLPWRGRMLGIATSQLDERVVLVPQDIVQTIKHVEEWETYYLQQGYEGVMLRDGGMPYKFGRSTLNEQKLIKLKRFEDSEAYVNGVEELMHNANEATTNALGLTERSSHKDNLVPMGKMGALVVKDMKYGWEFKIGTGFSERQRCMMWDDKANIIGRIVKYKFQRAGMKDVPRFPVFLGFRDPRDV